MKNEKSRRSFLKNLTMGGIGATVLPASFLPNPDEGEADAGSTNPKTGKAKVSAGKRAYNTTYKDEYLNRVAFPIGGIGAGMFCLEGTGAISHMSIRHRPEVFHEPGMFAAIAVRGSKTVAKVLEGPVPEWKIFGQRGTGNGSSGASFGLPRLSEAQFTTRFPFAGIALKDEEIPLQIELTGWSPFIPGDEDNSSLPVGALEYKFTNKGNETVEAIFSYNSKNFTAQKEGKAGIDKMNGGYVLRLKGDKEKEKAYLDTAFAIYTEDPAVVVDYCWFRGDWWDPITMAWKTIRDGEMRSNDPIESNAPGASLFVPFSLKPGGSKTIRVMMAWYVPESTLKMGKLGADDKKDCDPASGCCSTPQSIGIPEGKGNPGATYQPWYSSRFTSIKEVCDYWQSNYRELYKKTNLFTEAFYASTLPAEVTEAIAANLTILKSPTMLRQYNGRVWSWEGCGDDHGCCAGSCTHVWNYAQALPHLFPALERSLRHTEFCENQNAAGHQGFRANIPITPLVHDFHAASDGQLGGIMKVYREWRINGDAKWLKSLYPMVKKSMDYCILTWDPRHHGVLEEPHHNTYDIEFWGPDGMCSSFYLGALSAMIAMGKFLKQDITRYQELFEKGKQYLETELYDGEYFFQKIQHAGLQAADPAADNNLESRMPKEAAAVLRKEGPKYQYGNGCLSDGVIGAWMARMCGLEDPLDPLKLESHLQAVHKYNLKKDLSDHANPQRPAFAMGKEGGLLLCTWPKGGKLSLPFVYSDEVWTGIEYQVASHLMLMGRVNEGLEIVRTCRDRYDGRIRNPFNEYECGHWYARAMACYGFLQGLTGVRYDAVDRTLYIDSKVGDFTSFLATEAGFGTVSLHKGKPAIKVYYGRIPFRKIKVSGKEVKV